MKTVHALARRVIRRIGSNLLVDRLAAPLSTAALREQLRECDFDELALTSGDLLNWTTRYYPGYRQAFGDLRHKKLLEFYISYRLLRPEPGHIVMDAAGGANGYLARLDCKRRIFQDVRVSPGTRSAIGSGVTFIEGDAGAIPLPDATIDRISCHHSFEHFQRDSDIAFLGEVQRLLSIGGRCCIVPVFILDRFVEVTDLISWSYKFDRASLRVIDPTATIPGSAFSGHYARLYDAAAFRGRILSTIDRNRFSVTLVSVTLDGAPVPDPSLRVHRRVSRANYPYRALLIERRA